MLLLSSDGNIWGISAAALAASFFGSWPPAWLRSCFNDGSDFGGKACPWNRRRLEGVVAAQGSCQGRGDGSGPTPHWVQGALLRGADVHHAACVGQGQMETSVTLQPVEGDMVVLRGGGHV